MALHFVKISQSVCSFFVIGHFCHFHWKATDRERWSDMSFCGHGTGLTGVRGRTGWAAWCGDPHARVNRGDFEVEVNFLLTLPAGWFPPLCPPVYVASNSSLLSPWSPVRLSVTCTAEVFPEREGHLPLSYGAFWCKTTG